MPKPSRVKRGGKYIGSWLVVVDGQRINLRTKDANEARRRARLVELGKWPPEEDAANAVKDVLDGMPQQGPAEGASGDATSPEAPPEVPPEVPPPSPEMPPSPAVADTVNAAAAEQASLAADFQAAMAGAGLDMSQVQSQLPDLLAGVHLALQGQIARRVILRVKGRLPAMVTLDETDKLRTLLGRVWMVQLAQWDVHPENWKPWQLLLGLTGITAYMQIGAMLGELAAQDAGAATPVANAP